MQVTYHFINEDVSIDVPDGWAVILMDLDRRERNNDQTETRRHASLDGMDYEGPLFDAGVDVEREVHRNLDVESLLQAIERLSSAQRELLQKVYFQGRSLVSIAAEEGVSHVAIVRRLNRIYEKLRKYLE